MTPFLAKDDFASGQGKGELSPTPDDLTSNPDPFAVPDVSTDPTPALFASKKVSPDAASSAPPAPDLMAKSTSSTFEKFRQRFTQATHAIFIKESNKRTGVWLLQAGNFVPF